MVGGILSPVHVVFLLVVVLMVFGAKRLPEMGKSLGSGLRGFKESLEGRPDADSHQLPVANHVATQPAPPAVSSPSQPRESVSRPPSPDAAP